MSAMIDEKTKLLLSLRNVVGKLQTHDEKLTDLINKLLQATSTNGDVVKDEALYDQVIVRSQHRVTLNMIPEGSICRVEVYKSKRPRPCSCGGKDDCPRCHGEGQYHPITGVLLERIT